MLNFSEFHPGGCPTYMLFISLPPDGQYLIHFEEFRLVTTLLYISEVDLGFAKTREAQAKCLNRFL